VVTARPSLRADGLDEVWDLVRRRLESHGADNRGRLALPPLNSPARLALGALLGHPPGKTLSLSALETAFVRLDIGTDLRAAIAALGHPVSDEPARQRADRVAGMRARTAAREESSAWPERWAPAWIDDVIRSGVLRGFDETQARQLVRSVRTVLDHLDHLDPDGSAPVGRVDLAAHLLGSSHALDTGTRLEAAATRALVHHLGPAHSRDLWEQAGAHLDLTSGPVLAWRLPLTTCGLGPLAEQATALGIPVHLTQFALKMHPTKVRPRTTILVVENPRIVEAAAQSRSPNTVIAANGNPSGAVRLLLSQLIASGASLLYHGDFDAAGLAMCARMMDAGLVPWRMDASDYLAALASAHDAGVDLPTESTAVGPTPWDPRLHHEFKRHRRIVHEERLLPALLQPR
jgi:uncharacterized protein (TIGR02679 family)